VTGVAMLAWPLASALAATHSSSIAVTPDSRFVWSVNPDNDSVSVFNVAGDANTKLAEIPVGNSPQSVAINSSGTAVYVVNQGSNSVSVIDAAQRLVVDTVLNVGTEPYGAALTPDGRFLYVACASSSNVYKIDVLNNNQILQTISVPGASDLRGVAISDDSSTVYVTQLLAECRPGASRCEVKDDGKQGVVYPISVSAGSSDGVGTKIALPPLADSGFTADRSKFCTNVAGSPAVNNTFCPPGVVGLPGPIEPNDPRVAAVPQGAYPNVIQNLVIVGSRAYVASLGTAPEPPVRFNVNVQALFSVLNLTPGGGSFSRTLNMNTAIRNEAVDANDPLNKVFFSMPWAFEVHPDPLNPFDVGYVAVQGGNMVVKLYGVRSGNPGLFGPVPNKIIRIQVGKDPRGLAINKSGTRAYVQNLISRDVSVINITTDRLITNMPSAALPAPGSLQETVLLGKELFNTSLGGLAPNDPNSVGFTGRFHMSDNGWGSCFNCHPFGLADGATWSFPNGPRQTIPLDGTVSATDPNDSRILNWTAVRTLIQDFEKNTEGVSGGFGLIGSFGNDPNGVPRDGVRDHGANRGLDPRADAIEEYVRTIAAPRAVRNINAEVAAGRDLFLQLGCDTCHGGGKWSKSLFAYDLPASSDPDVSGFIVNGQITRVNDLGLDILEDVDTFDPNGPLEIRGAGNAIGTAAQGAQGFNVPSLLGAFRHAPYFRDGRHASLRSVIDSGHGSTGGLTAPQRDQLEAFLETVDDTTPPILSPEGIRAFSDHNSPIHFSPDERYLYTANADNNSMSVVYIAGDENRLVTEVDVGREPRSVAAHPDNRRVFVANQRDGTISVVQAPDWTVVRTISDANDPLIEPYGLALTRDGRKLLITCAGSDEIAVLDVDPNSPDNETIVSRVKLLGHSVINAHPVLSTLQSFSPRGIAISSDDQAAVVTLFIALPASGAAANRVEGFDDGKSGYALLMDLQPPSGAASLLSVRELPALADTGFTQTRANFCNGTRDPDPANQTFCTDLTATDPNDPDVKNAAQGAFPNLLQSVSILSYAATAFTTSHRVYFPSIGSSPEPPVNFAVNVQALVSGASLTTPRGASVANPSIAAFGDAVNLNRGINFESAGTPPDPNSLKKVFLSTLWDLRFKPVQGLSAVGFALSAGSNVAVRVTTGSLLTGSNSISIGAPADANDPGSIVRVRLGKNPQGLAISSTGARLYSYNTIGRSITAVNISNDLAPVVLGETVVARLPEPGTPAAQVLLGKELFNTGIGPAAADPNFPGRFAMSDNGWGNCFNCHPFGLADGVTWIFANGPRQTIPLDSTFSKTNPADQRVLNWTAVRSSVQDFEKNTENVSGGFGLIDGFGNDPNTLQPRDGVKDHLANRGLDPRADAINEYVRTIRPPIGDKTPPIGDPNAIVEGQNLFDSLRCWTCHGSGKWSTSFVNYPLPATAPLVNLVDGQVTQVNGVSLLQNVNSFSDPNTPAGLIEVRANGAKAQGENGFNPPSLLGAVGHAPYFHDGRFRTLFEVVNSNHGHGGLTPIQKSRLTQFLRSIDDSTVDFPVTDAFASVRPSINSSPIAATPDGKFVVSVNPDADSVTVIETATDTKVTEFTVGKTPRSIAISQTLAGNVHRVYVTNQKAGDATGRLGTVSVLELSAAGALSLISTISVGAEPYGCALTPNGNFLFVANMNSGNVSVIRVDTLTVAKVLDMKTSPRSVAYPSGIGITDDGDNSDSDEKVYVTLFLAQLAEGGAEGFDQGKEGQVVVIDVGSSADASDTNVLRTMKLPPLKDTGFTADRTPFRRQNGAVNNTYAGGPAEPQAAFPNLIQSVFVRGNRLYFPSLGSQPEPPVRFNVNVQALITTADAVHDTVAQPTLNMNRGVGNDPDDPNDLLSNLFFSAPWQLAIRTDSPVGYTVVSGGDVIVRTQFNTRGDPTINAAVAPVLTSPIKRIQVGKNPQGITVLPNNTKAYVMNYISRDVSVVNLALESVVKTIQSTALPAAGSQAEKELLGKELFNSSRGPVATDPNFPGRFTMSDNGWGSCFNCHPFGLSDGVTWIFADGPRQTIPLDGTFGPDDAQTGPGGFIPGLTQRILNYGAVRSTVQDFEKNTENVSGGFGLIGPRGAGDNVADHKANRGLDARADAIEAYVASVEAPISPASPLASQVVAGRQVFLQAGCDKCHSGSLWTTSRADYTLPASADPDVVFSNNAARTGSIVQINGQTRGFLPILFDVGTFNLLPAIEIRGAGGNIGKLSGGADGFNAPSLLGIAAQAPYFHDGTARDLEEVFENVEHRKAGQAPGVDLFTGPSGATNITNLVAFLRSVGEFTPPADQPPAIEIVRTLGPGLLLLAAAGLAVLAARRLVRRRSA
jgi:YVTN family beta-propeller protein